MKTVALGNFQASSVALGCMRLAGCSPVQVEQTVKSAMDAGINLFDHADIYGAGASESLFGALLQAQPHLRGQMLIQSKCGIGSGFYDFSYEHILSSVEGSLRRLQTDRLDLLLLHRPDILARQEEVAAAITYLRRQGMVLAFGASNMNPAQIALLEQWTGETFLTDQMQLSLLHGGIAASALSVNTDSPYAIPYDSSLLPYCQRTGKVLQAWSPLQYGMFQGCFLGNPRFPKLNQELERLADKYQAAPAAIALSWILSIPCPTQVILGSCNPRHIRDACQAPEITLTRREWYGLYTLCGYPLP